jgi:hypothetical protein
MSFIALLSLFCSIFKILAFTTEKLSNYLSYIWFNGELIDKLKSTKNYRQIIMKWIKQSMIKSIYLFIIIERFIEKNKQIIDRLITKLFGYFRYLISIKKRSLKFSLTYKTNIEL